MNILLSRILTYLNGTLFHDYHYKICTFIIFNYLSIEDMDEQEFLEKGLFKKEELYSFIALLGFDDYETFKSKLVNDHQVRFNQIRVRMIDAKKEDILEKVDTTYTNEEILTMVDSICEDFYNSKRIVIFGALYPISIAVELQTDMISLGKPFIQYHTYDPIVLNENDVAIVISATGRYLDGFRKTKEEVQIDQAKQILITQNKKYVKDDNSSNKVIYLPGRFDSIDFNYQIMAICDLIRITYFDKYYL